MFNLADVNCCVANAYVNEGKPFDIDDWMMAYDQREDTCQPQVSDMAVKQAVICEADLRGPYLETDLDECSYTTCNDESFESQDESDEEIAKVS